MSRTDASILHADLDSFFASVEQRDDPSLRGRPVIVGGGVVLAASYEAKAFGIRTAMGGGQAHRLCPSLVVVPPRFDAYTEASRAVFEVFDDTTPFVEGISIDEAFLDVGGLRRIAGTPVDVAVRLRREVRERVGLAITVGVARTKFLAKVASAAAKPDGLLVVPPDGESAFLHPLPVERVWGVGAKTAEKLHARGIDTVGDMARVGEGPLVTILGGHAGRHLFALANHRDPRHVQHTPRRRSIGSQSALGKRRRTPAELDAVLVGLVDRVTRRMRTAERVGRTVTLRFRFDDFTRATRSHTTPAPTAETEAVLAVARGLLGSALPVIEERGLTLLGMAVGNLGDDGAIQLALPFDRHAGGALDHAIDDIREKFGTSALTRTVLLGHDHMAMPLLAVDSEIADGTPPAVCDEHRAAGDAPCAAPRLAYSTAADRRLRAPSPRFGGGRMRGPARRRRRVPPVRSRVVGLTSGRGSGEAIRGGAADALPAPGDSERLYRVIKALSTPLYHGLTRVAVEGRHRVPGDGGVIVAANHISFFDSVVLLQSIPRRAFFIGKAEYMRSWTTRRVFPAMGLIPIEREQARKAMAALEVAAGVLERGDVLSIYPEGTRSRDGRLHRGHTGVAQLALMSGAPIVPVGLVGTDRIQPIGARVPRPFRRAVVRFGAPLDPASYGGSSRRRRQMMTDDLMEAIRRLSSQAVSDDFASPEPPLVRGGNESVYQVLTLGGVGATFGQAARFAVSGVCSQFDDGRVGSIRRLGCRIQPDGTVRFAAEVAVSIKFQPNGVATP